MADIPTQVRLENASFLPILPATSTHQTDGLQKTQIVDSLGNPVGVTAGALNVTGGGGGGGAVTVANGADVTQGTTTDARNAATDGTAATVVGVLKEISYMEQNPAARAVTGSVTANAGTNLNTSGLATEAGGHLASIDTKMTSGTDIGDVTINNGAAGAAVNIQDGGNSITVDGTFFQATQPVSLASAQVASGAIVDGAMVTVGNKTDAADTHTDGTSVSMMSVLKEISAKAQSPSSTPVTGTFYQVTQPVSQADGQDVTLGAKADNKSTATDTTAVSVMSVLKEISYMEQNPASRAVTGTVTVSDGVKIDCNGTNVNSNSANIATEATLKGIAGFTIAAYDYVSLSYTGNNATTIVYKTGGSGGTTVATLTLTYDGSDNLLTITKS